MKTAIGWPLQVAALLLLCAANARAQAGNSEPPSVDIWTAVSDGRIGLVRTHIAAGTNLNATPRGKPPDFDYRTPLWIAVTGGHKAIVMLLLENGANPNKSVRYGMGQDRKSGSPLHFAVWEQSVSKTPDWTIAEMLVEHGADVEAKSGHPHYNTLLQWAMQNSMDITCKWLLAHGAEAPKSRPLLNAVSLYRDMGAAREGYWVDASKAVQLLIEQGADPGIRDAEGNTPLHLALKRSLLKSARILIANGADIHVKNRKRESPYSLASELEDKQMLKYMKTYVPPRLNIEVSRGVKRIGIVGLPDQLCYLYRSTDLENWVLLDAIIMKSKDASYLDKTATGDHAFYMVKAVTL